MDTQDKQDPSTPTPLANTQDAQAPQQELATPVAAASPAPAAAASPTPAPTAADSPAPVAVVITASAAIPAAGPAAEVSQPSYGVAPQTPPANDPNKLTFSIPIEISVSTSPHMAPQPANCAPAPSPNEAPASEKGVIGFQYAANRGNAPTTPSEPSQLHDPATEARDSAPAPTDQACTPPED